MLQGPPSPRSLSPSGDRAEDARAASTHTAARRRPPEAPHELCAFARTDSAAGLLEKPPGEPRVVDPNCARSTQAHVRPRSHQRRAVSKPGELRRKGQPEAAAPAVCSADSYPHWVLRIVGETLLTARQQGQRRGCGSEAVDARVDNEGAQLDLPRRVNLDNVGRSAAHAAGGASVQQGAAQESALRDQAHEVVAVEDQQLDVHAAPVADGDAAGDVLVAIRAPRLRTAHPPEVPVPAALEVQLGGLGLLGRSRVRSGTRSRVLAQEDVAAGVLLHQVQDHYEGRQCQQDLYAYCRQPVQRGAAPHSLHEQA
mmetsp:Transcript_74466/g.197787  ORF Transcript_74466/g.197787 Transcript_74466/m.197787 type:complete len:312 (-) Transcript_74466:290-1225(-)